jgi:hypothetical protein
MDLFPEALLRDVQRLPGANHSFLKQMAGPADAAARAALQAVADQVGPLVAERWADVLSSVDNRRFFQGYAEVAVARLLLLHGWSVDDLLYPGPTLQVRDPQGRPFLAPTLAFIHQHCDADVTSIVRLTRSLDRVGAKARIVVMVDRWLPHDFDPEPVRRAVEVWLKEVDRGGWDGRYASYEDEHVSLEFGLTGERAKAGEGSVALTIGPFGAQRMLEIVERRAVHELESLRLGPKRDVPVLLCAVADRPWRITQGFLRELLYGKAWREEVRDPQVGLELTYRDEYAPCLFRDPLYRNTAAVLMVGRSAGTTSGLVSRVLCNPWTSAPLRADDLPSPRLWPLRSDEGSPVLAWSHDDTP